MANESNADAAFLSSLSASVIPTELSLESSLNHPLDTNKRSYGMTGSLNIIISSLFK